MSAPLDPRQEYDEHGEWDALAVGWALSAVDREDEERFAAHLPGCARCTATVRESLYTVADLAYALPDEAPPASMKTRLMAAVAAEPRTAAPVSAPPSPAEEEWPLGEPHPGSPGFSSDWFARRAGDRPGDRRAADRSVERPAADRPIDQPAADRPIERPAEPAAGGSVERPAGSVAGGRVEWPAPGGSVEPPEADGPGPRPVQPASGGPAEPTAAASAPVPSRPEIRRDDLGGRHSAAGSRADRVIVPMEPRRRGRRVLTSVAAAAVVALIAALGAWNLNLRSEQNDLRQIVAQREAAIQQLTANEPARIAALTKTGQPSPTRQATLVVRGDQVEIIVETLGATPANRTYWLWTLRCDNGIPADPKPVRGFTVTQSAFSVRNIGSDADAATATCFAISSEPGTATPTAPTAVQAIGQPTR